MRVGYGGGIVQGRPVPGWKTHMVHDAGGEFTRAGRDAGTAPRKIRGFFAGPVPEATQAASSGTRPPWRSSAERSSKPPTWVSSM
ncbi:hypothetical protein C7415_101578 [Cupriavidus alkaliphilus]|nr:hypothetical protein [Cupriavidus alkaliphilus]RAS12541.1 hypothetical protein C7415_101578 [Cupriavidus alkaliphilus]